jgi:hypothetical protein
MTAGRNADATSSYADIMAPQMRLGKTLLGWPAKYWLTQPLQVLPKARIGCVRV